MVNNNLPENEITGSYSGEEAAIKAFNEFLDNFHAQTSTRSESKPAISNIHKTKTTEYGENKKHAPIAREYLYMN